MSDVKTSKPVVGFIAAGVAALFFGGIVMFAMFRVDVPADKVLIATRLSGEELAEGDYITTDNSHRGVLLTPYNEGLYWFNPYTYETEIVDATIIKAGEVGVLIRLFGDDLPGNQLVASPGYQEEATAQTVYKGIVPKILTPSKYNINTRAYRVERYPAFKVPPGYVGVSINLAGPVGTKEDGNAYVNTTPGAKGVEPETRQPGTYYINPYIEQIVLFEVRAQRFDFTSGGPEGDQSIDFQSSDAFTLNMEGTIEWSVDPSRAPEILCRLSDLERMNWGFDLATHVAQGSSSQRKGSPQANPQKGIVANAREVAHLDGVPIADLRDIVEKVIRPYTRSYVRLLGAKYAAAEYISGQRRMEIQKDFQARLRDKCEQFGVRIGDVAITRIVPPSKIKEIINNRSLQVEQRNRITQNIEKLRSDAQLRKKQESIRKSQLMVDANTTAEKARIRARQNRNVALKEAEAQLAVAGIELAKAETEKERYIIEETAKLDQEFKRKLAEVEAFRLEIDAAGGGANYIRSIFVAKLGGGLGTILTNDDSFFMEVFQDILRLQNGEQGPIGPQPQPAKAAAPQTSPPKPAAAPAESPKEDTDSNEGGPR